MCVCVYCCCRCRFVGRLSWTQSSVYPSQTLRNIKFTCCCKMCVRGDSKRRDKNGYKWFVIAFSGPGPGRTPFMNFIYVFVCCCVCVRLRCESNVDRYTQCHPSTVHTTFSVSAQYGQKQTVYRTTAQLSNQNNIFLTKKMVHFNLDSRVEMGCMHVWCVTNDAN